jgi:ABC-2 type transport system permease protein
VRLPDLLGIEVFKTIRRRAFWVTLGGFAFLLTMQFGTIWYMHRRQMRPTRFGPMPAPPSLELPNAWAPIVGAIAALGGFFLAVCIILLIAAEFPWRTTRQNVIDGLSKEEYFAGKLLLCALLIVVFIVVGLLAAGTFAVLDTPNAPANGWAGSTDLMMLGGVILAFAGYAALALFFAFALRSSGSALGVTLLYLAVLEPLIAQTARRIGALEGAPRYFPTRVFSALVARGQYDPALRGSVSIMQMARGIQPPQFFDTRVLIALAIGYVAVFISATYALFRSRDL